MGCSFMGTSLQLVSAAAYSARSYLSEPEGRFPPASSHHSPPSPTAFAHRGSLRRSLSPSTTSQTLSHTHHTLYYHHFYSSHPPPPRRKTLFARTLCTFLCIILSRCSATACFRQIKTGGILGLDGCVCAGMDSLQADRQCTPPPAALAWHGKHATCYTPHLPVSVAAGTHTDSGKKRPSLLSLSPNHHHHHLLPCFLFLCVPPLSSGRLL